jgi:hypothetical protein
MILSSTILVLSLSIKRLSEEMNCCDLMFSYVYLFQDIWTNEIIGCHLDDMINEKVHYSASSIDNSKDEYGCGIGG